MSHFHFDGTSYITTPTFSAAQLTGAIDMRATVRVPVHDTWRTFVSTSGQRTGYHFRQGQHSPVLEAIHADGNWREGSGDVAVPVDEWVHARATVVPGDAFRFTIGGADAGDTPCSANPGRPETSTDICIGAYIGGATATDQYMKGDIAYVEVCDGVNGPSVLRFSAGDPNIPDDTPDGASWTDENGLVWTVHGDGISFVRSAPVARTIRESGGDSVLGGTTIRIERGV